MADLFPISQEMNSVFDYSYDQTPESIQKILIILKMKGYSQIQCIRLLIEKLNISLSKADNIVLLSDAWSQEKDANLKFRQAFLSLLKSY